jgi:hypothetical protein
MGNYTSHLYNLRLREGHSTGTVFHYVQVTGRLPVGK